MARAKRKDAPITYFYLIKNTAKGVQQSTGSARRGQRSVTRLVKASKGRCVLYRTPGGAYDYVSVVTGVSASAALEIAADIETGGHVQTTLLAGTEPVIRK